MKIIALMNQKGGVGKTTLALSLAGRWHLGGSSVSVIDADPQRSSFQWKETQADDSSLSGIDVYALDSPSEMKELRDLDSDYVIIDTPGTDKLMGRASMEAADAILIPTQPSALDIRASGATVQSALATGKPVSYVVTRFVNRSQLGEEVMEALGKSPAGCIKKPVGNYQAYVRSIGAGETPSSMFAGSQASRNVESVGQYIDEWLRG